MSTPGISEGGQATEPSQLRFLKDRRVTFIPFVGADPDEQVVIEVRLESGFLVEAGQLTATKGEITKPPGRSPSSGPRSPRG
jgi:hypothetical protein